MAAISLPPEIELEYDTPNSLYARERIHGVLLEAAKSGNGRAYYHLANCFENDGSSCYSKFVRFLKDKAKEIAIKTSDVVLLAKLTWDKKAKRLILGEPSIINEGERLYYAAVWKACISPKIALHQSYQMGYTRAKVQLGFLSDNQTAFRYYLEAGSEGIPEGYFKAALMIQKGILVKWNDPDITPEYLFQKAGEGGCMQGYLKLMEMAWEKSRLNEAIKWAGQMDSKGDPSGLRKLGDWYRSAGDKSMAKFCYLEAGPFEGYAFAAEVEEDRHERYRLRAEADKYTRQHYNQIMFALYHPEP